MRPKKRPHALAARGDRIVAKSRLLRQERDMVKVANQAIQTYLRLVRRAVATQRITAAADPDPDDDDSDDEGFDDVDLNALDQSAAWPTILDRTIMPELTQVLAGLGPQQYMTPAVANAVNTWRAAWLAGRRIALTGVPDQITKQIRDAIQADTQAHGPNPRNAASIVRDLLNPDAPTWKSRAQTIARTEVVGANNQGGLASYTAIHQSLAPLGGQVYKTWLATEDSLTRPDHADIDGTEIGISDTFSVGESQMTGPGDESADAGEVINCRCTLTYRIDDGTGSDDEVDADEAEDAADNGGDTDAGSDDGESEDDSLTAAAPEAPVTAPAATPDAPPQSDGTPSEATTITPGMVQWQGVLAELDTVTSDGRMITSAGLTIRELPLPLKYQREGEHGGDPAGTTEIVGRILTAEVRGTQLWGTGDFFDPSSGCYAAPDAINQVAAGIGGVSVDLPVRVVSYLAPGPNGTLLPVDPSTFMGDYNTIIEVAEQSELAAATIVDVPAFGAARIDLVTDPTMPNLAPVTADAASPAGPILAADSITFPDGTVLKVGDQVNVIDALGSDAPTTGTIQAIDPATSQVTVDVEDPANPGSTNPVSVDVSNLAVVTSMSSDDTTAASGSASGVGGASSGAGGLTAALAFPGLTEEHVYPAEWFEPVVLDGPTRLTITDEGRVYGHAAEFGTCHIGYVNKCVAPPTSPSGYGYFHVGEVKTTDGLLPVGKLTVGGGHADIKAGWVAAVEHYDNAGAAVAVVRAHEDEFGIQVTGALLPTASGTQIAALRRNHLSGDWRPIGGQREMVAAHSINTGGFPLTPRAALAADGRPMTLVAAGIVYGAAGDGEPEASGITLPSGTKIPAADLAILAASFAEIIDQREQARVDAEQRADDARTLRLKLVKNRLHAVS